MKVYITRYNADMTEGRGPMVVDKVFLYLIDAANYIDSKAGVFGRKSSIGWSNEKYGDWDIQEVEVFEGAYDEMQDKRNKALAKLSAEDRELLGL